MPLILLHTVCYTSIWQHFVAIKKRLTLEAFKWLTFQILWTLVSATYTVKSVCACLTCQQKHGGEEIWGHLQSPAPRTWIHSWTRGQPHACPYENCFLNQSVDRQILQEDKYLVSSEKFKVNNNSVFLIKVTVAILVKPFQQCTYMIFYVFIYKWE